MCITTGLLCLLENTHAAPEGSTLDLEHQGNYPYLSYLSLFLIIPFCLLSPLEISYTLSEAPFRPTCLLPP